MLTIAELRLTVIYSPLRASGIRLNISRDHTVESETDELCPCTEVCCHKVGKSTESAGIMISKPTCTEYTNGFNYSLYYHIQGHASRTIATTVVTVF